LETAHPGGALFSREGLSNEFSLLSPEPAVGGVGSIPEMTSRHLFYCPNAVLGFFLVALVYSEIRSSLAPTSHGLFFDQNAFSSLSILPFASDSLCKPG
jgi:hypothetical protein